MPNLVKVRNGAEGICGAGELYNSVLRSAIPEIRHFGEIAGNGKIREMPLKADSMA